jgi:hypothetical protein
MDALYWFYRAAGNPPFEGDAFCYLCARPCGRDFIAFDVLRDTFNDFNLARCPSSRFLCPACGHYFDHKPEYRKSAWVLARAGERYGARAVTREGMREAVLRRLARRTDEDMIFLCPTSKKKHIALLAPVTPAQSLSAFVQFELQTLRVGESFRDVLEAFDGLRDMGMKKSSIISDSYAQVELRNADAARFAELRAALSRWRNTATIRFASFVAKPREEEEENGGTDEGAGGEPAVGGLF